MCFNQDGAISLLNGKSLKLVNKFSYVGSNVNKCIAKTWIAIDMLMIMWESHLSDKIGILPSMSHVSRTVWLHHLELN